MNRLSLHCRHLSTGKRSIKTPEVTLIFVEFIKISVTEYRSFLCLSHFDDVVGPELIFSTEEFTSEDDRNVQMLIPNLIDITQGKTLDIDPFIFSTSYFQSQNLIFSIREEGSRGKKKDYLLTFILTPSSQIGSMGIGGLETFFLSCVDEYRNLFLDAHKELGDKQLTKTNLTSTSAFSKIREISKNYHKEILEFLKPILSLQK